MAIDLNTHVSADLHPDSIFSIDGYDDVTAPYAAPARGALEAAYKFIGAIHAVRDAALSDPELTPAGAILKADDFAQRKLAGVTTLIDGAVSNLDRSIASIENELSTPVKAQASLMVSGEVRATMKASKDRMAQMEQAFADKDEEVLSAVLGAPAMLSGFSREIHQQFLVKYHSIREPAKAAQLRVLRSAKERLENRGGLVLSQMIKAVGTVTDPATGRKITPQELRQQRAASNAVYAAHG